MKSEVVQFWFIKDNEGAILPYFANYTRVGAWERLGESYCNELLRATVQETIRYYKKSGYRAVKFTLVPVIKKEKP